MALFRPLSAAVRRFMPTTARELHSIGDITMELRQMQNPTNMQRRILVLSRIYKSMNDVPNRVSLLQIKKAYDIFRCEVTMAMMIAGTIGCLTVIEFGKRKRRRRNAQRIVDAEHYADFSR